MLNYQKIKLKNKENKKAAMKEQRKQREMSLKQTSLFCGWLVSTAVEGSVATASASVGGWVERDIFVELPYSSLISLTLI